MIISWDTAQRGKALIKNVAYAFRIRQSRRDKMWTVSFRSSGHRWVTLVPRRWNLDEARVVAESYASWLASN